MSRRCTGLAALAGALLLLSAFGDRAVAQSFDCKKARTATEQAICNAPPLGFLDSDMARTYERAHVNASRAGKAGILEAQRAWLRKRDTCGGTTRCLMQSYLDRLHALGRLPGMFPGWAGAYENWSGLDIVIAARPGGSFAVALQGAGADYTCGSKGTGRPDGAGRLAVTAGKTRVQFDATGTGLLLPEELDQPSDFAACGANAPGVGGYYRRTR